MFGAAELSDEVVAAAAAEGSHAGLARVCEALLPQVRLMVWTRLMPTPVQATAMDDVTQEVMLALTEGISRLETRTVAGLKAFVSGIVAHKVADRLKRPDTEKGAQRPRSLDSTVATFSRAGPLWQFISNGGTSPSSAAGRTELAEKFFAELGKLKPEYREVITLALVDELATRDIGQRMNMSRNAAAMLLKRACKALRRRMAGTA